MFADLERFPRRQVFRLEKLPNDLAGFDGAAEYDFSHFRTSVCQCPRREPPPVLARAQ